jgi:alkylated DNA repair dioxygenase AlkB
MSVRASPSDLQPDLFDGLAPAIDTSFATASRIQLDETSWIDYVPAWLEGSSELFEHLRSTALWEQRDRWMFERQVTEPRLTAEYPQISDAPASLLQPVAAALSEHYRMLYRRAWINLYRTHRDSTSWHGDVIGKRQEDCIVPVLSLGATRRFLIRPRAGGASITLHPAGGDLVVMGGRTQRDWRHCVPKQATPSGERISVNFAPDI